VNIAENERQSAVSEEQKEAQSSGKRGSENATPQKQLEVGELAESGKNSG